MTKCRVCQNEHAGSCASFFSSVSRATPAKKDVAKAVAKPVAVNPVKPRAAEPGRSNVAGTSWRERDPEAYRKYMREYMAKRRAAGRVS